MKLTNHQKNNYTYDDTNSGSSMNGTITMTRREMLKAISYLHREYKSAQKNNITQVRDGLGHLFNHTIPNYKVDRQRICWGVCATGLIAKRYNLKNYKLQNYVIICKN